jgi:MFS family permease
MPAITDKFNSLAQIGWYGSAYLLAMCLGYLVFHPSYTDLVSQPTNFASMHFTSFVFFELGSLLCGFASNSVMILAGRAITGIGAAGGIISVVTIVVDFVPKHKKKLSILLVLQGFCLGRLFGPL